ncbi:hypothetical protein [Asticcacaulis sp.]|jgi:hypothetical protein|uniref:hypothetical protein n=1 Tax=Asticcacaulis sp. TaxID=1872648 RepID=UPI0031D3C58F
MKRLALLLACALLASAAYAEPPDGEGASGPVGEESAVRPKPRPRPKAKPKPKAVAPAPRLPEGPIPYVQLQNTPVVRTDAHTSPAGVAHVTASVPQPPPSPPVIADVSRLVTPPAPSEALPLSPSVTHDLKCDTQVVGPKGLISKGQFHLEVELSDVFPEDTARFKMVMADPRHQSLLKDTACETLDCRVTISANYYDLYNARTKRGAQLRVTLDRHTGAYLARRTDGKLPLGGSTLIKEGPGEYEEGYCTLQKRPEKLF